MNRQRRRGMLLLGMAAAIALLGYLAYAAHASTMSAYREAARMRWRATARELAQGGLATVRVRLSDNPAWTGETWNAAGIGRALLRVIPEAADATASGAGDARTVVVECFAQVPPGPRPPLETVILRARLRLPDSSGTLPPVDSAWWISPGAGAALETTVNPPADSALGTTPSSKEGVR